MRLDAVRWSGGELIFSTSDPAAVRLTRDFQPGEYDLVPKKQKRSLDANAYCWVLIDKLAEKTGLTKTEIYRNTIRDIGGVSDTVCVQTAAADDLCRAWEGHGIGWQTERMPSKLQGCTNVVLFYGSSAYDAKQMSLLIDHLVQDCKALGIETLTPQELERMKVGWKSEQSN